jgi:hypothetical protein
MKSEASVTLDVQSMSVIFGLTPATVAGALSHMKPASEIKLLQQRLICCMLSSG